MPKFSILIPCYNCANTLPETLQSCLDQTYQDFEVIMVDDCSPDDIKCVFDEYKPNFSKKGIQITYLRNDINQGVSKSRNLAWDKSSGDYVCFLDSDDIWHRAKLQIVNEKIEQSKISCIAHSYSESPVDFFSQRDPSAYALKRLPLFRMLLKNYLQTSCVVLKRSISYRFNTEMSHCEDYELWLRLLNEYQIYLILGLPLTLLSRPQLSPGGLSSSRLKMRIGQIRALKNFISDNSSLRPLFIPLAFYNILKHIRSELRICIMKWVNE